MIGQYSQLWYGNLSPQRHITLDLPAKVPDANLKKPLLKITS